jgi:hypothetical protein
MGNLLFTKLPSFTAYQIKCGVHFSCIHTLRVTVHKIQSCYKVHVVVGEPQLPYKDSNTAVYLHFVQMTQAHLFLVQVKPINFLPLPSVQGQFHPVFPQHVFCILHTLLLLTMAPVLKPFHVLVNCCPICNWCNSKLVQP